MNCNFDSLRFRIADDYNRLVTNINILKEKASKTGLSEWDLENLTRVVGNMRDKIATLLSLELDKEFNWVDTILLDVNKQRGNNAIQEPFKKN